MTVRRIVFMLMTAVFVSACAAPVVRGTLFDNAVIPGAEVSSLALSKGEAVVVLSSYSVVYDDAWPVACVGDAVASAGSDIRVVSATEFRDAMFPWFETHDIEKAIGELRTVPGTWPGIDQIGVRYIIAVAGQTTESDVEKSGWSGHDGQGAAYVGKHGLLMCGAGCLGFMAWQRASDVSAVVWDLRRGIQIAAIAAKVTGTTLMPALGLPVPLIAPTETASCSALGSHLAKFLTTGEVPESKEVDVVNDEPSAQ